MIIYLYVHLYIRCWRCYQYGTHQTTPRNGANQQQKSLTLKMIRVMASRVSQPGIPDQGPVCRGDCTQRSSLWVDSELFLYLWCRYINGHKCCRYIIGTPIPGTVAADFWFPTRSVCYCGFFVLCLSRALICAYQGLPSLPASRHPSLSVLFHYNWVAFMAAPSLGLFSPKERRLKRTLLLSTST